MRRTAFINNKSAVPVLAGIALVLFGLNLVQFLSMTFADDATRPTAFVSTLDADLSDRQLTEAEHALHVAVSRYQNAQRRTTWGGCRTDLTTEHIRQAKREMLEARHRLHYLKQLRRHEATVQQELKLRAAQNPEVDEALQGRLGLNVELPEIPIMR